MSTSSNTTCFMAMNPTSNCGALKCETLSTWSSTRRACPAGPTARAYVSPGRLDGLRDGSLLPSQGSREAPGVSMLETRRWHRQFLKTIFATAVCRAGVHRAAGSLLRRRLPVIVGYHRVVEAFDEGARYSMPGMLVSRTMLEQHLDWIGRHHRFVSLDEIEQCIEHGDRGGQPLAAVTFDDGYRDIYEQAFPLLMRKGIPATLFVVTSLIGTARLQRHDELYLLLLRAMKTWVSPVKTFADCLTTIGVSEPKRTNLCRSLDNVSMLTVTVLRALHGEQ